MNFLELLICAKAGNNEAAERILTMYQPILVKESVLAGALDEDLYQELCLQLFLCMFHQYVMYIAYCMEPLFQDLPVIFSWF